MIQPSYHIRFYEDKNPPLFNELYATDKQTFDLFNKANTEPVGHFKVPLTFDLTNKGAELPRLIKSGNAILNVNNSRTLDLEM